MGKGAELHFCGTRLSAAELEMIRETIGDCAGLSRTELANTICELLEWRRSKRVFEGTRMPPVSRRTGEQGYFAASGEKRERAHCKTLGCRRRHGRTARDHVREGQRSGAGVAGTGADHAAAASVARVGGPLSLSWLQGSFWGQFALLCPHGPPATATGRLSSAQQSRLEDGGARQVDRLG